MAGPSTIKQYNAQRIMEQISKGNKDSGQLKCLPEWKFKI